MKIVLIIFGILIYLFLGIVVIALFYIQDGTVYLYESDLELSDFLGVLFWPLFILILGSSFVYVKTINFLLKLFNKEDYKNDERNND